jgi:hypothetical protein
VYPPSAIRHVAGVSTAEFTLQVVNPQQLTRHEYEMTFSVPPLDTIKTMSIRDLATGANVITGFVVRPNISTPTFDGLKLTVNDKPTDVDTARSKFNRRILDSLVNFQWTAFPTLPRIRVPLDWFIAFNRFDTTANGRYVYPGDTVFNTQLRKVVVCPFYFRNIDSMQAGYAVVSGSLLDSMWRPGRAFVIRPQPPIGSQVSYQVNMNFTPTLRPTLGDTLWIFTQKGIEGRDVYRFTADSNFVLAVPPPSDVTEFKLFANYPNPFNPTTTIRYHLPRASVVQLKVFDILGREVATLVNSRQDRGEHTVEMNAGRLASGVYFYRLEASGFVSVKRMLVVK